MRPDPSIRSRDRECLAQAAFGVLVPIAAVGFGEDGGVRESEVGFVDEDFEDRGGLIEFIDDFLVREHVDGPLAQHLGEVFALGGDA